MPVLDQRELVSRYESFRRPKQRLSPTSPQVCTPPSIATLFWYYFGLLCRILSQAVMVG